MSLAKLGGSSIFAIPIAIAVTLDLIGFVAFKKIKLKIVRTLIIIIYFIIYGVPILRLIYQNSSLELI